MNKELSSTWVLILLIFQAACARSISTPPNALAFATFGSTREVVESNLRLAHHTIAHSSGDKLVARLDLKHATSPMNVELTFDQGKLLRVQYWPIPVLHDWTCKSRLGLIGYRLFIDKAGERPLRYRYLYFGSLGCLHFGTESSALRPNGLALCLGILTLLGVVSTYLWSRRRNASI
jgi:hypothetical protein